MPFTFTNTQTTCNIFADVNAKIARLLLLVLVPSHLFYMAFIYALQTRFDFSVVLTAPFVLSYCTAITIQLVILLYLAYVSVFWAWKVGINPDNSAIPFTSALADVLGNCLMAAAFTFLHSINDPNAFILEQTKLATSTTPAFGNFTNSSIVL